MKLRKPKEIKTNIELAAELDEVEFIREQIKVCESYNSALSKPKSSIAKNLEELTKDLAKVERKINTINYSFLEFSGEINQYSSEQLLNEPM